MELKTGNIRIQHCTDALASPSVDSCLLYDFRHSGPVDLHPDGHFEFIFQIRGEFDHLTNGKDWVQRPRLFIGGLHNKSFVVNPKDCSSRLISVRIKAHEARNFLPGSLHHYKNSIVDLEDLYARNQVAILDELNPGKSTADSLKIVRRFLTSVYNNPESSPVDHLLQLIEHTRGDLRLEDMTECTGLSAAQIRKRFTEQVGMSPKEYARIVRFNHVAKHIQYHSQDSLTEIAYALGYYDQAHFIKDFRTITGISPKVFRRQLAG